MRLGRGRRESAKTHSVGTNLVIGIAFRRASFVPRSVLRLRGTAGGSDRPELCPCAEAGAVRALAVNPTVTGACASSRFLFTRMAREALPFWRSFTLPRPTRLLGRRERPVARLNRHMPGVRNVPAQRASFHVLPRPRWNLSRLLTCHSVPFSQLHPLVAPQLMHL